MVFSVCSGPNCDVSQVNRMENERRRENALSVGERSDGVTREEAVGAITEIDVERRPPKRKRSNAGR